MNATPQLYRHHEIRRIKTDLERDSFPRLQMLLLVTLTGASGFFASFVFLHAGLVEMWRRYLVSFGVAYVVFLFLLWLWLRMRASKNQGYPDLSGANGADSGSSGSSGSSSPGTFHSGKGGDFGGGGASGSFDASPEGVSAMSDSGGSVGDALGAAAEAEEFAIPLAVLIILGTLLFSSLFMIYLAPTLFAELLVDGVLSASLYRRLRTHETRHWLQTALRHTVLPFALTAAIFSACGWLMTGYAPEAHSIWDVIAHAKRG